MNIDIPNTLSLWQLILSALIFLVTFYAFYYAKGQWQKDNFLKVGTDLIALEEGFIGSFQKLTKEVKEGLQDEEIERRQREIISQFLNRLDMYAFYFQGNSLNPRLDKYFKNIFVTYWKNEFCSKYIEAAREDNPSSYKYLEDLVKSIRKETANA